MSVGLDYTLHAIAHNLASSCTLSAVNWLARFITIIGAHITGSRNPLLWNFEGTKATRRAVKANCFLLLYKFTFASQIAGLYRFTIYRNHARIIVYRDVCDIHNPRDMMRNFCYVSFVTDNFYPQLISRVSLNVIVITLLMIKKHLINYYLLCK